MSPARTPDTSAAGRLQRLLALVPWVLDHPEATVDEVDVRATADGTEILMRRRLAS